MLVSRRRVAMPALGASLSTLAVVHRSYRLHLVDNQRVVTEDALVQRAFDRRGALDRPVVTLVLEGRSRIARAGATVRWLEPGDLAVLPGKSDLSVRQEGERFTAVVLEWDPGVLGPRIPPDAGRVGESTHRRIAELVRSWPSADTPTSLVAAQLGKLLALVRAEGLPIGFPDDRTLVEPVRADLLRLAGLLDRLLSNLRAQPMVVDLERALGIRERAVTRAVSEFNTRYGFNATGWRDTVLRRRLLVGAALMTARGATTERVARELGYASPVPFCHAMAAAGLPSPGSIGDVVARLR